jgi:hypothetical protein
MKRHTLSTFLSILLVLALATCAKKEAPPPPPEPTPIPVPTPVPTPAPFHVTSVDLGSAIGADKKVTAPASQFTSKDTIYAAVSSDGAAPKATIKVRWTFGPKSQLVNEETRDIAPTGPAVTEFHISKPSGWPVGGYKVEVSVDGTVAATKDFAVKK